VYQEVEIKLFGKWQYMLLWKRLFFSS